MTTVQQLIEKLSEYPKDLPVFVAEFDEFFPEGIKIEVKKLRYIESINQWEESADGQEVLVITLSAS